MPKPPTSDDPASTADEPPAEPESTPGGSSEDPPDDLGDAKAEQTLEVGFHLDTSDMDPPASGWIEDYLRRAAALCGVSAGSLSVTLVDDAEMKRLHGEYCDDPSTTDVLTFDLRDGDRLPGEPTTAVEGDLAVCRDEAQRQAEARGHDARVELLLYAVHGLLHLLGEDDHEPEAYQRMHRREDEILTALGLGAVFESTVDWAADIRGGVS